MSTPELSYTQKADAAIRDLLLCFECQPILFVGSGLSQRYFGAPTWRDLLRVLFRYLPDGDQLFEYYRQKLANDPIAIGSQLADLVFEWAWKDGRASFPAEMFTSNVSKDAFVKRLTAEHIKGITPAYNAVDKALSKELSALVAIKPHAIITTNFDLFLESAFDGYQEVTGQTILRYNTNSFGEIFHIHGDVSDYLSLVLTNNDYYEWTERKKYVSAKLLTYFAEHPVFLFGYGLGDPNVKAILRDIGEIVADENGLIGNIYQIVWHPDDLEKHPPEQAVFAVDGKEYRINAIHTMELRWVYEALQSRSALTSINPKLVRALAARTMKLIRHDIPSGDVLVDYDILERVANDATELPKLLGITTIDNPNQSHPFTLTQVAQRIGLDNWQGCNKLLNTIKDCSGIDLRSSDNRYHCKIKTGIKESSAARKWSHEAIDLLTKVKDGAEYELGL